MGEGLLPQRYSGAWWIILVVVDVVMDQLDRVHERIAGRFTRSEPRGRAWEYVVC
ncbi:hypothetical protein [Amycolatopsis sp. SID8362]|uniref:hypothetical protein n=1 Tax=Amycolatopsis sp. SID8362 TaxID=2690346 RepID=UPI0013693A9F|nr:hypothetical protein [Amycolatopsis sp. SID8362]NBH05313.1 hypothetical protein [Amycolatopsis sp. SID8362]NED42013.1 hypothetical protein [Amycolatopsis sp. SID8362]